jgi:DNA-directed RNA polymerase specialized sigma24 family protein
MRRFASTRWSLVRRVTSVPGNRENPSAAEWCRLYWHPLYAFLRSRGHGAAECEDYVQSFLIRVLNEDLLKNAEAGLGRFRSFLTTLLLRHVAADRRRASALKRGGGTEMIPLDWTSAENLYLREAAVADSPEDAWRRTLAVRLIEEAVNALRQRYTASGQKAVFEELLPALEGPLIDDSYPEIAARLELNKGALRVAVVRMRARFRENLQRAASVALQIPVGPALDDELRDIFR